MELIVDLGSMPKDPCCGFAAQGLRDLRDKGLLCDVEISAGGRSFHAHRVVLAAVSPSFYECLVRLTAEVGCQDSILMQLDDIKHSEAVQAMLDCIYAVPSSVTGGYNPSSEDANRDVLRLAQRFQVTQLQDQAWRWLTNNLTTSNVITRLAACDEFGLVAVRENIFEQLTANPQALYMLVNDPEVIKVPVVLQALLIRVLRLLGCGGDGSGTGKVASEPQLKTRTAGA